jgi:hypothetical protein
MTKQEIGRAIADIIQASQLAIYGGKIASPGKFEGQQAEVLYFYDAWLNGDGVDLDDTIYLKLTPDEQGYFKTKHTFYKLVISDGGFVSGQFVTLDGFVEVVELN